MAIIPGLEGINFLPIIAKSIYYLGIGLLSILILALMWVGWRMTTFKIGATIFPLYGSGKDGVFSVGKPKYNRIKWIHNRSAWLTMKPFMNRKEREPFDQEFIYPGNKIYAYELNDEWIPARINVGLEEDKIRAEITPVPFYIRNWQSLMQRKHEEEFAKIDFWSENKYLFITIGCVIACVVLCLGTIYLAFKFAQPASANMASLTDAIKNMNMIKGIAPG